MRLIAWNCAMGLPRKLAALRALRPDIAVLSEVACPARLRGRTRDLDGLPIVWVGDNPNKGLAVVSFTGATLVLGRYRAANKYIAPVHVDGARKFRLLAVWDHNDRTEGLNKRPGPLLRALADRSFCRHDDLVVAGDFNNNPLWDRPNGPDNMARVAAELRRRGLVSLYHHKTGLAFGAEIDATYWHYRAESKPYHIDYIFVPQAWLGRVRSFHIGAFAQWCASGLSDHAPLVAEFG